MEDERFDMLARSLSRAASSRRRLLSGVAGSGLGALAAVLGITEAGARRCKKRQRSCTKGEQCCGHKKGKTACKPLAETICDHGDRCCGLAGASCPNGGCDCCTGFACSAVTSKCQRL
jgi:hypothetical protein